MWQELLRMAVTWIVMAGLVAIPTGCGPTSARSDRAEMARTMQEQDRRRKRGL